ncbi:unnamed protein product, partial [Rotaria magnacalcarata]
QHGPNDVASIEPFENLLDARSTGGCHRFALAY